MLRRRDSLKVIAALGCGWVPLPALPASSRNSGSPAPTVKTPVRIRVPPGACDSHVHVFPDPSRYSPNRSFTPPPATAAQLLGLQRALMMDHVVIVNSTVYGPTIEPVLQAIEQLGQQRARGIALFDPTLTPRQLDDLHARGIRGIRVFLGLNADVDLNAAVRDLAIADRQVQGRPWHIQVYGKHLVLAALRAPLAALQAPLVIDHFCGLDASQGMQQTGFKEVLELVGSGKAYVKLSGAYYCSDRGPDYADMRPYAQALIAANPDRILWGSDWPHPNSAPVATRAATQIAPAQSIDDGLMLNQLATWAPDATLRQQMLVGNPKRLYGF
ncbi:amidohydrolase family protein [Pseudomonas silvicola]|nr:amidohydrolase family protein [Pseudomonas silvicola]